jgi:hypothetical protein
MDLKEEPKIDPYGDDAQMEYIKVLLWRNRQRIKSAPNPNAELTYVLYEHIRDKIKTIVDKKYIHHGHIMILGGI